MEELGSSGRLPCELAQLAVSSLTGKMPEESLAVSQESAAVSEHTATNLLSYEERGLCAADPGLANSGGVAEVGEYTCWNQDNSCGAALKITRAVFH